MIEPEVAYVDVVVRIPVDHECDKDEAVEGSKDFIDIATNHYIEGWHVPDCIVDTPSIIGIVYTTNVEETEGGIDA